MPNNFYKINKGLPQKAIKKTGFSQGYKFLGKGQLFFLVIGVYLTAGSIMGYLLFNSFNDGTAQADASAYIVSSLKINEDNKEYKLQDQVKFEITIQNTSNAEVVKELGLDLYSSDSGLKWSSSIVNTTTGQTFPGNDSGHYNLNTLGLGQKSVYIVTASLENNQKDITIYAKVSFVNKNGVEQIDTNKVYLKRVFYEVKMVGSSSL